MEDRLDGASNYGSWKLGVLIALEEYDVKDFAVKEVHMLEEEERQASLRIHNVKARNIFYGIYEDSLDIPHLQGSDN